MNVAGALVKGVLPQPIHHLHHALVVGVELLVAAAQLHQLLEAGGGRDAAAGLLHGAHGFGQREEFSRVAADVRRVGHHAAHHALALALHFGHPVGDERLAGGHHHFAAGHLHGQHLVALGVGGAHGFGHFADFHLERVNAQVAQARAPGQVFGQALHVHHVALRVGHANGGQAHQRVLRAFGLADAGHGALGFFVGDHAVLAHPLDEVAPLQRAAVVLGVWRGGKSVRGVVMAVCVRNGRRGGHGNGQGKTRGAGIRVCSASGRKGRIGRIGGSGWAAKRHPQTGLAACWRLARPARARLRAFRIRRQALGRFAERGANSRGSKTAFAHYPLGHHAINQGAKTGALQPCAPASKASSLLLHRLEPLEPLRRG